MKRLTIFTLAVAWVVWGATALCQSSGGNGGGADCPTPQDQNPLPGPGSCPGGACPNTPPIIMVDDPWSVAMGDTSLTRTDAVLRGSLHTLELLRYYSSSDGQWDNGFEALGYVTGQGGQITPPYPPPPFGWSPTDPTGSTRWWHSFFSYVHDRSVDGGSAGEVELWPPGGQWNHFSTPCSSPPCWELGTDMTVARARS